MLQMCAIFAIVIVPTTILPVMIAEEKGEYTLRSLMLARVSGLEFLAAKLEVCLTPDVDRSAAGVFPGRRTDQTAAAVPDDGAFVHPGPFPFWELSPALRRRIRRRREPSERRCF